MENQQPSGKSESTFRSVVDVRGLQFECGNSRIPPEDILLAELGAPERWFYRIPKLCGGDAATLQAGKSEWDKVWKFSRDLAELSACLKAGTLKVPLNIRFIVG